VAQCLHRLLNPFFLIVGLGLASLVNAQPISPLSAPEPLKPWTSWVLHGESNYGCTWGHAGQQRWCAWPGQLELQLNATQGIFKQRWWLDQPGWVSLPGSTDAWPQNVTVNGQQLPVGQQGVLPRVWLPAGENQISGGWFWMSPPATLQLPTPAGLVALKLEGKNANAPINEAGVLQLATLQKQDLASKGIHANPEKSDGLQLQVHRKLQDGVPFRLETRLLLSVSGRPREILVPAVLLPGFEGVEIQSALQAELVSAATTKGSSAIDLRLQVRPGEWDIRVISLARQPFSTLTLPLGTALYLMSEKQGSISSDQGLQSRQELWSYINDSALRQTRLGGVLAIDPQTTQLPLDWKSLPTYSVSPGQQALLLETRRGQEVPPADQLTLQRTSWLDFNGQGWTWQDRLQGAAHRSWRLSMPPNIQLGRVSLSGADQPITRLKAGGPVGIELRQGQLDALAESRYPVPGWGVIMTLPAVGWGVDVERLNHTLQLPPSWQLLSASGVDKVQGSWWSRWELWDFFVVLLIALASHRLMGWRMGLLALSMLLITSFATEAPREGWLLVLVTFAIHRYLPASFGAAPKNTAWLLACGAMLVMTLATLAFAIQQLRITFYPSLEYQVSALSNSISNERAPAGSQEEVAGASTHKMEQSVEPFQDVATLASQGPASKLNTAIVKIAPMQQVDPSLKIQTGPGLPDWRWNQVELTWTGPVQQDHKVRLWLQPPWLTRLLNLLGILLLIGYVCKLVLAIKSSAPPFNSGKTASKGPQTLTWAYVGAQFKQLFRKKTHADSKPDKPLSKTSSLSDTGDVTTLDQTVKSLAVWLIAPIIALLLAGVPDNAVAIKPVVPSNPEASSASRLTPAPGTLPSEALLQEYKNRLLAPPACSPECASISRMKVSIAGSQLILQMEIHATQSVAVPLPGGRDQWLPERVALNNTLPLPVAQLPEAGWVVRVPPGVSQVFAVGSIQDKDSVTLTLPLVPRQVFTAIPGWRLDGLKAQLDPSGNQRVGMAASAQPSEMMAGALQLTRLSPASSSASSPVISSQVLKSMIRVTRTLQIDRDWRIQTRVERLTPSETPLVFQLPLLAGEILTDSTINIAAGQLQISLPAGIESKEWTSLLTPVSQIELQATLQPLIVETWVLQSSAMWHVSWQGLPRTVPTSVEQNYLPIWQPWPGEKLKLQFSQPQSIEGDIQTLDQARLIFKPGLRVSEAELQMQLRASRATHRTLTLPVNAQLQEVLLNKQLQSLKLEGQRLIIPIQPGASVLQVRWREPHGMQFFTSTSPIGLGGEAVNYRVEFLPQTQRWIIGFSSTKAGHVLGPALLYWGVLTVLLVVALILAYVTRNSSLPLGLGSWMLLAAGLSTVSLLAAAISVGWLALMHWRINDSDHIQYRRSMQVFLILATGCMLSVLVLAVQRGLLGQPDMVIGGNGSTPFQFNWYMDRVAQNSPALGVYSIPITVYRLLMLLWALWLAHTLLRWLRWGWRGFTQHIV
jgi:hypothetical protein